VQRRALTGTNLHFSGEGPIAILLHFDLVPSWRELHDESVVAIAGPSLTIDEDLRVGWSHADRHAARRANATWCRGLLWRFVGCASRPCGRFLRRPGGTHGFSLPGGE